MLKVVYTLFTGLLLSVFIGVGIAAFYTAPKSPDCWGIPKVAPPTMSATGVSEPAATDAELEAQNAECTKQQDAFQASMQMYSRNVSVLALGSAILFLIIGLTAAKSLGILADGFLLGGLFTLLYSVGVGFESQDFKYRFVVVSVGVLVALLLGYLKFVRPEQTGKK